MDDAKLAIRRRLGEVKSFLAQEAPPKLSESDTKANFIEPIVSALGWAGIGVVTREYYVRNSQEFIDYVMAGPNGPLLAIEAKPLRTDLSDKHAAQLVQYCAVEGIEWAALTNGRELQFFNTFLKPDLAAKRVLRLDLLAFNSDAEFDALFAQVWQLSRESMTTPAGVRSWLNQRRLDAALRAVLLDPASPALKLLRREVARAEVAATAHDLAAWFRAHLAPPLAVLPVPTSVETESVPSKRSMPPGPTSDEEADPRRRVTLRDLIDAGLLQAGTNMVLVGPGRREVARAKLTAAGEISWDGRAYRSPSDKAFCRLLGRSAVNGWTHWHAELPEGRVPIAEVRARLAPSQGDGDHGRRVAVDASA